MCMIITDNCMKQVLSYRDMIMPWLTIPYDDEEKRVNIFNYYQEFNLKNRNYKTV
jgi:hypothetical protein